MERLAEGVAGVVLITLGPETGHELVAGDPCLAGRGEEDQQSERPPWE
jgi:hypothetical protein